jgi:hypothetical protein
MAGTIQTVDQLEQRQNPRRVRMLTLQMLIVFLQPYPHLLIKAALQISIYSTFYYLPPRQADPDCPRTLFNLTELMRRGGLTEEARLLLARCAGTRAWHCWTGGGGPPQVKPVGHERKSGRRETDSEWILRSRGLSVEDGGWRKEWHVWLQRRH